MTGEPGIEAEAERATVAYRDALKDLDASPAKSPALVIAVIDARDKVARVLADNPALSHETLETIDEQDHSLQDMARRQKEFPRSNIEQWCKVLNPPEYAWWWRLDEPKPSPLWTILIAFCVVASISLTTEISRRFLAVGADFLSVFSTLSQIALTLLAGSALTRGGRESFRRLLSGMHLPRRTHHLWMAGLSLAVFLVLLGFWSKLPAISASYSTQGMQLQDVGRVTSAIERFQRAISLNNDNTAAHYNLATAYEDVLDYDRAINEYQIALRADDGLYAAYNNLARLYLLRAGASDWGNALKLLDKAIQLDPADAGVRYSLFKNRGWAEMGLQLYGQAEHDLRQALKLRPDGAAAHCLLGQLLAATGRVDEATGAWESCLAYAAGDFVESSWLAQAREELSHGGGTE